MQRTDPAPIRRAEKSYTRLARLLLGGQQVRVGFLTYCKNRFLVGNQLSKLLQGLYMTEVTVPYVKTTLAEIYSVVGGNRTLG